MNTATQSFYSTYLERLRWHIENNPEYSYTKSHCEDIPALANKMLNGFLSGAASKDGDACRETCKALKIKHTYKAIKDYCLGVEVSQ